jgi:hypothetical protein
MQESAHFFVAIGAILALGMALVFSNAFPQYLDLLLPGVIGSTIVFEIIGPLGTRAALSATNKVVEPT